MAMHEWICMHAGRVLALKLTKLARQTHAVKYHSNSKTPSIHICYWYPFTINKRPSIEVVLWYQKPWHSEGR